MDVSKQWISLVPYRRPGHFANVAHLGFRHGWRRSSKPSQCPTPRRQRSTVFCLPSKMCKWTSIGQILTIWGRVFTKVTVNNVAIQQCWSYTTIYSRIYRCRTQRCIHPISTNCMGSLCENSLNSHHFGGQLPAPRIDPPATKTPNVWSENHP